MKRVLSRQTTTAFAAVEEAGLSDEILELAKNPAISALADEIVQLEKELVVRRDRYLHRMHVQTGIEVL